MAATDFNIRQAISEGVLTARNMALPTAPYYLIAGLIAGALLVFDHAFSTNEITTIIAYLVEIILTCMVAVVFYRLAVDEGQPGEKIVRNTRNLFLAMALVSILFGIVLFLLLLFFSIFSGILLATTGFDPVAVENDPALWGDEVSRLLGSPAGLVLSILVLMALAGLFWLSARLVLYGVTTVVSGRIRVFQTWGWTRGAGLGITIAGSVMVFLPLVLAILVALFLESAVTGTSLLEESVLSVPQNIMVEVGTLVLSWPIFLLGHGFAVAVYNQLCPELLDVEEAFG